MKAFILITLLISSSLFAADSKTAAPKKVNGVVLVNDSIQKLLEIDGVKTVYEGCKTSHPGLQDTDAERTTKVLSCLWDNLTPDVKKKVQAAYTDQQSKAPAPSAGTGRSPASAPQTDDIVKRKTVVTTDYEKDPAVIALSKFYGDKLDAILDPSKDDEKKNVILAVDHRKFIELYKSELGKTIISAFTSYCIETDPMTCGCASGTCRDTCDLPSTEQGRADNRRKNLDDLKTAKLDSTGPDSKRWTTCILSVPKHCKDASASTNTDTIRSQDETTKRSCLIMDYVESAKKNIMLADKQNKFYDDLQKEGFEKVEMNTKELDAKKSSTDSILEVSSTDIKNNMKDPVKKQTDDMSACYDSKTQTIKNADACKEFLSTDKEANQAAVDEMGLRAIAQEGVLKDSLDSSTSKVRDYLKEEGYEDADIAKMTKDDTVIAQTKEEILERYKNEKAAIIAEMAKKIDSKTSTTDGKVDAQTDVSKIRAISDELNSRTTDLAGLVQFDNIVSSYLTISSGDGNKATLSRNTASLFNEVSTMSADDAKIYNEQIKDAKLQAPKTDSSGAPTTTNLNVKDINASFLNYSTQKDPTTAAPSGTATNTP